MPLVPLDELFSNDPDLLGRIVELPLPFCIGPFGLPRGEYYMRELYCTDPACDCRFVQVHFVHESNYGLARESPRPARRTGRWPVVGGRYAFPIAASVNYCWRWRKQQAYVKVRNHAGHWVKLDRVRVDLLGPQIVGQLVFQSLLRYLLWADPKFDQHFRKRYQLVKQKMAHDRFRSPLVPETVSLS